MGRGGLVSIAAGTSGGDGGGGAGAAAEQVRGLTRGSAETPRRSRRLLASTASPFSRQVSPSTDNFRSAPLSFFSSLSPTVNFTLFWVGSGPEFVIQALEAESAVTSHAL